MALDLSPIALEALPDSLRRMVGPAAPAPLRLMAARGLAPLKPAEQVTALYQLSVDDDAQLRAVANDTTGKLPDKILSAALGETLEPRVVHFLAQHLQQRRGFFEPLLLNRGTADDTVILLAHVAGERELEMIGTNEERILRCPDILTAMYLNKATRQSTVDRLVELCARNGVRPNGIPSFDDAAAAVLEQGPPAFDGQQFDIDAQMQAAQEEAETLNREAEAKARTEGRATAEVIDEELGGPGRDLEDPDADKGKKKKEEKKVRIEDLPMTAKIRLAMTGNTFHRAILIRDTKKQVALAAVRSPAVTELEIQAWSANRALSEDVLRYIANSRTYLKDYQVKKNLCFNPKVPAALTMGLLQHLQLADLIKVSKSKNVPQNLVTTARRMVAQKQSKK